MRQHCLSCESCLSYDLVNPVVGKKERNVMDELIGETQAAMIACSAKRTGGILQKYIAFFFNAVCHQESCHHVCFDFFLFLTTIST